MSQRILVVDDEPLNLLLLTTMLQTFDCEIHEAHGGAEAWTALQAQVFDRVLLDVHTPGISGLEVAARLRAGGGPNSQVPIVAVSGDLSMTPAQYLRAGFDARIEKPISFATVRASLEAPRQPDARAAQA
jgi:CheY-like chemotaxis protein